MRSSLLIFAVGCLLATATAQQQESPKSKPEKSRAEQSAAKPAETKPPEAPGALENPAENPKPEQPEKDEHFDMTEVPPVVTHQQVTVGGQSLKYTATAGRLPIKRGDGKIDAEMFFVAYTLDGQDPARRPLTFAFNGGPGSASIWREN